MRAIASGRRRRQRGVTGVKEGVTGVKEGVTGVGKGVTGVAGGGRASAVVTHVVLRSTRDEAPV